MNPLGQQVRAQLLRLSQEVPVFKSEVGGSNSFGNPDTTYEKSHSVMALRSYANRNTRAETRSGDRGRDNPVFFVPVGDNFPDAPESGDRLKYDGTLYEVNAITRYETHVEFMATEVVNDE